MWILNHLRFQRDSEHCSTLTEPFYQGVALGDPKMNEPSKSAELVFARGPSIQNRLVLTQKANMRSCPKCENRRAPFR